jgi:hypothetical protein
MNPEDLNQIGKMPLDEAKILAVSILEKRKVKTINQKTALAQTIRDIKSSPTSNEVMRIMYQQFLASEGLRTVGSAWKSKYDNI